MNKAANIEMVCLVVITGVALVIMHRRLHSLETAVHGASMAAGERAVSDANAREHSGHLFIVEGR